jgi:predicted ATP-dependent endonuclease of OLD family
MPCQEDNRVLTSLTIENWKSYERATLNVDALTVLIGTNSSGKSNLLDALAFLNRIASGTMSHPLCRAMASFHR